MKLVLKAHGTSDSTNNRIPFTAKCSAALFSRKSPTSGFAAARTITVTAPQMIAEKSIIIRTTVRSAALSSSLKNMDESISATEAMPELNE